MKLESENIAMKLIDYINSDLKARGAKSGIVSFCRNYFSLIGGGVFRYPCWLRVCHFVFKDKFLRYSVGWLCLLIRSHYEVKYGIVTPSSIKIGRGLNIVHGGGVFLNCESIGDGAWSTGNLSGLRRDERHGD